MLYACGYKLTLRICNTYFSSTPTTDARTLQPTTIKRERIVVNAPKGNVHRSTLSVLLIWTSCLDVWVWNGASVEVRSLVPPFSLLARHKVQYGASARLWRGTPNCSNDTCPSATSSTRNPTSTYVGANPDARSEREWVTWLSDSRSERHVLEPTPKSEEAGEFYTDAFQRFQSSGNAFVRMFGEVCFNNTKSFMTGIWQLFDLGTLYVTLTWTFALFWASYMSLAFLLLTHCLITYWERVLRGQREMKRICLPSKYKQHVRRQLKCDGTRLRTGGDVKGKLVNGVGSQYPSHYLGTWYIQHYYRWCAHLGFQ